MRSFTFSGLAASIPLLLAINANAIQLVQDSSGQAFFDAWTFVDGTDTNFGNVLYATREVAMSQGLAFFNGAGNAIIKLDNVTDGRGNNQFGRNSVKLLSNNTVSPGSLIIADMVHMPFGCSIWPAIFTQGPNWPSGGEIDILENVNLQKQNRYSLHTLDGCKHPDAASSSGIETGNLLSTDCFNATNGNEGCVVQDTSVNSFGDGFNNNGGGVYATLWDDTGIKTWFFERSQVPSDASSTNPDPSKWGTPTAFFPQSSCDTTKFFTPQTITIQIDICGSFANAPGVFSADCSGNCLDMVGDPRNYDNGYFEMKSLRVFTGFSTASGSGSSSSSTSGTASVTSSRSGSQPTQSTGTGSGSGSGSGSGTSGSASRFILPTLFTLGVAVMMPVAFLFSAVL